MTTFPDLRRAQAVLFAVLLAAGAAIAQSDDVQEASKLLRSGQPG